MSREPSAADPPAGTGGPSAPSDALIRCLDVAGAGAGLVVLSPLLLAVSALVKLTSRGPALYRATRIGRDGRPFILLKFRSMVAGADTLGPAITSANDLRVTAVGKRLRALKLDELPQLFNVVKGDMSLVGPRPEAPEYVAMYTREQRGILDTRPGMTSPASLRYRDEEAELTGDDWRDHYIREVMPAKLGIDLEYCRRRSAWTDLKLILATVAQVARRQAAR